MIFTKDITLNELNNLSAFSAMKNQLISGGDFFSEENGKLSLAKLQKSRPTWNSQDIIIGLENLYRVAVSGIEYVFPVYSNTEINKTTRLSTVQLIYLPAQAKRHSTFVILLAGGGYGAVCTMVESLPVAAKLNELGISCFCLNYRTAVPESFKNGLLPEPIDDLAAAMRTIKRIRDKFNIDHKDYMVGGFSAGGHVASLWGTEHLGARKYGIAQPKMLILVYPLITMESMPDSSNKQMMCTGMFGEKYSAEDIIKYDSGQHIDSMYPKTFLAYSTDDPVVPHVGWDLFATKLKSAGVPYTIDKADSGGHGFGLGSATPLNGWVERATACLIEK